MSKLGLFKRRGSFEISDKEPVYKVRYLGNVQTAMMKGDGCVDKPVSVIWNNYLRSPNPGLEMKLTITTSGLQAHTKEQGLTEYRAHRISYCIAHPQYPKLFIWVYRHEGKKMKMELRCHAVLCKSETKAKSMALQLHEKISFALKEFMREKTRRQNSRLVLQRTRSLPHKESFLLKRTQFLSMGQNFKPPIAKSNTAPKLGAITEDVESGDEEDTLGEIAEDELDCDEVRSRSDSQIVDALTLVGHDSVPLPDYGVDGLVERVIDLEIGNDIAELKSDNDVQFCINNGDSDDESSESGFHEQDLKDATSLSGGADDTSIDGEEPVCDVPSPGLVEEETVVTSL